jgi:hypothetical protein
MALLSKRVFTVISFLKNTDKNGAVYLDEEREVFHIDYMLRPDSEDTPEFIYALHDIGDKVLDLKVGDHLFFQPNRDIPETFAIIIRNE